MNIMSTIRIDEEHVQLLEKLLAGMRLLGKKMNKKELVGKLIENAYKEESIRFKENLIPLDQDPAWIGLDVTFDLGITDLSTKVDEYLYKLDGDE